MSMALCWEEQEPLVFYASLRAFCLNIPIFYYIIDNHTAVQFILENYPRGIYFRDCKLNVATLGSVHSIICIIFICNACLNRLLLEYYLSSAKCHTEVNLRMQLQYALMKGLELCMCAIQCVHVCKSSVSITFLMLWFTGKWCLDKDKLLAHILTT